MGLIGRRRRRVKLVSTGVANALFTRTQQRILGLLFGNPSRSLHTSEIIRLAGTGSGAAQRELERLYGSGLLLALEAGNQVFYEANPDSPIFDELTGIIVKTVGLAEPIREALAPIASRIRAAFVFGSVAKRVDKASSDIDLLIVSDDVTYAEVFGALEQVSDFLGRPVNPTLVTLTQIRKQRDENNSFVTRILKQPKIWILGAEEDLGH